MTVRLRAERQTASKVRLVVDGTAYSAMRKARSDELFDWYEGSFACAEAPSTYCFLVEYKGRHVVCQKGGASWTDAEHPRDRRLDFRVTPGFHVPEWAQGALQYQIFPDRFMNGDARNDVVDAEYAYDGEPVRFETDWCALPHGADYRHFYGGDLQGVMDKLDYLQSLGVEAIYLNPVFVSPSSHKYDTQDYRHIDPHLGVVVHDEGRILGEGETDNARAERYIARTTHPANLERSDELFAELCAEVHRRGMRIILDGVFNHCGSFSRWMDREGIYRPQSGAGVPGDGAGAQDAAGAGAGTQDAGAPDEVAAGAGAQDVGAFQSPKSPYRPYFRFGDEYECGYEAWWDFESLPKLNYEESAALRDEIVDIARHWASPPYRIDGWRLDVAADLGHSEEFNHEFWREFRRAVREANPELLIVAEHYGDATPWLSGDQWDTVMNYDAFMDPLTYFLTGMEKHSDRAREDLYQDGEAFFETARRCSAGFDWASLACAMNQLSNHDHSRFLTRTNRTVGRLKTHGSEAAGQGVDMRVMREAVVVQMTWPGAPTIYYGDEAGLVGWTDPDNRRAYPWGREDWGLVELHQMLAGLRRRHPALRTGAFAPLGCGTGWFAFGRFTDADRVACACNNEDWNQTIYLRLRMLGMPDGTHVFRCLRTTGTGFTLETADVGTVRRGILRLTLPARCAIILTDAM